ncbi:hypothetical protein QBC39DRAFT_30141 [Podospora conica]|nr:hypothetical protein QBC39DRAFT_30141 [Schizothecium conicum]
MLAVDVPALLSHGSHVSTQQYPERRCVAGLMFSLQRPPSQEESRPCFLLFILSFFDQFASSWTSKIQAHEMDSWTDAAGMLQEASVKSRDSPLEHHRAQERRLLILETYQPRPLVLSTLLLGGGDRTGASSCHYRPSIRMATDSHLLGPQRQAMRADGSRHDAPRGHGREHGQVFNSTSGMDSQLLRSLRSIPTGSSSHIDSFDQRTPAVPAHRAPVGLLTALWQASATMPHLLFQACTVNARQIANGEERARYWRRGCSAAWLLYYRISGGGNRDLSLQGGKVSQRGCRKGASQH